MGGSPGPTATGGAEAAARTVGGRRAMVTTVLMNLASIVERADEGILPAVRQRGLQWHSCRWHSCRAARRVPPQAVSFCPPRSMPPAPLVSLCRPLPQVYMFIGRSLNASLSQLGTLTLVRALFQARCACLAARLPAASTPPLPAVHFASPPAPRPSAGPDVAHQRVGGRPLRSVVCGGFWLPAVGRDDRGHWAQRLAGPGHGVVRRWVSGQGRRAAEADRHDRRRCYGTARAVLLPTASCHAPLPNPYPAAPPVNGFGLALVIPCVSSMIADYHPAETRGNAFGVMGMTGGGVGGGGAGAGGRLHRACGG